MKPQNHCAESAAARTEGEGLAAAELIASEVEGRSGFYRMLAKIYYWPYSQEELDAISTQELKELAETSEDPLMASGYNDMYRFLRRRHTGTREDLSADFTRCFMGTTTFRGIACVPYASIFLNAGGELMGKARAEVRKVYRANRIELKEGIDLPEDHLSFEFEFMAIIGERCAKALRGGELDTAVELLDLQLRFLKEHILTWTDRFFNLSVELVRTRFYRGAIKVTKGFLANETDSLLSLRARVNALRGEGQ